MPRALFRFNVGPRFGAGHMSRCLALASALEQHGYSAHFAVNAAGIGFLPRELQAAAIQMPDDLTAEPKVLSAEFPGGLDVAVLDHYGVDSSYEAELRPFISRLVAIDDLADRRHCVDVLIDSAPGQPIGRYAKCAPKDALLLLGPDYAMLRGEFRARRTDRIPSTLATGVRILVAFGATDSRNATARVLDALIGLPGIAHVTAVLGKGAPHTESVRKVVQYLSCTASFIEGAEDMAELVLSHDIGIGAPGTSALERACLGLPQVLVQIADNQAMAGAGLAATGSAILLGVDETVTSKALQKTLEELISDPSRRLNMRRAGSATVDGLGTARLSALLASDLRDRSGRRLAARRIRAADADTLFYWQTDETTRRYFLDPSPPTHSGHALFVSSCIESGDRITEIVTRGDEPVAIVRADPSGDGAEVSIVVAPQCRGQGIGSASLAYIGALAGKMPLTAMIDEQNVASIALFSAAGYGKKPHRSLRTFKRTRSQCHAGRADPT